MPKFLFHGRFSTEGVKGIAEKGGTSRVEAVEKLTKSVGGKLEAYYFALGDTDYYVVADLPDNKTAAAIALIVGGGGALSNTTTVLMTPAEMDEAAQIKPVYRPPGA
jgi:uncharacterized protein with GYD domain